MTDPVPAMVVSFDANAKISRLSFDADETEAEWLVLAVCHRFCQART